MCTYGTFSNRPLDGGARVIEVLQISVTNVFRKLRHEKHSYIYVTNLSFDVQLCPVFYSNHLMSSLRLSLFPLLFLFIPNFFGKFACLFLNQGPWEWNVFFSLRHKPRKDCFINLLIRLVLQFAFDTFVCIRLFVEECCTRHLLIPCISHIICIVIVQLHRHGRCSVGRIFSLSYSQNNKERREGKEQRTDSNIHYMCPSKKGSTIQYGLKLVPTAQKWEVPL